MFFQAVMKFLSRLVEFKILVNWGMVHWNTNMAAVMCKRSITKLSTSMYNNEILKQYPVKINKIYNSFTINI